MPDSTNALLRWTIVFSALLVLFVPLYVENGLFFPFITGKAFAFRAIVEAMAALWLILMLRDPSARPKRSFLLYAASALLLSLLVSVFLSENPAKSFWSNFERMEGWIGVAHVVLYFGIVLSTFDAERYWKWWWNTAIGVSIIEALYGVGQLLGWFAIHQGGVRLDGTFGNATYLAVYMLFGMFMALFALARWGGKNGTHPPRALQAYYGIALVLDAVILFYTATRGAVLGLVAGLLVAGIVIAFAKRESKTLRAWGVGVLLAFVLLGGAFYAIERTPFVQHNEVLARFASIDTPQKLLAQGFSRFAIWRMAWDGIRERPLFGWGQESFNYLFNAHYSASLYAQEQWFDRAHNEFLDILVAGGAVAFFLYLSLFALALRALWRKGNTFSPAERGLLTGLIAAYAVNNLFVFDNLMSYVYFFTLLAYIGSRSAESEPARRPWGAPLPKDALTVAAPLAAAAMAVVFYFVNVPGIAVASDLIEGLSPQSSFSVNLDYFKRAATTAGTSGLGAQEVHEQLVEFANQVKSQNVGDTAFQSETMRYASEQMALEAKAEPNDARTRLFYGEFLLQNGAPSDARAELEAAHRLSPQKQQILFELGNLSAIEGNAADALGWFKEAYDLAPGYDEARVNYAALAVRVGDRALASSLLMPRFGTATPDNDTVLAAYFAAKDYPDGLVILAARVEKNPNDYHEYVNLAAGYLQAGEKADAIAVLQKAIELEPSFKTQGQSFIDQIRAGKL